MTPINRIILGICPTMSIFAQELTKKNKGLEIINLGSAAQVLYSLSNNEIDVGLIGRKAKKSEFEGYSKELKNDNKFTLVSRQKDFILKDELEHLPIYISLKPEIIKKEFPELKNIIFVNKSTGELKSGEVRLISWDNWNDNFELLIPIDKFHNKIIKFRKSYLFSKNKNLVQI